MTIEQIINAVESSKSVIANAVSEAKAKAAAGTKMPVGMFARETASKSVASGIVQSVAGLGYVPVSCRFLKAKVDGSRDLSVTYRVPTTLEARLQKHAATVAARKAKVEARRAAKVAKETPAPVTNITPEIAAVLAKLNLKAA